MKKNERDQKIFKGNMEHLDILLYSIKKNDIGFWNTWREKNHNVKINLCGANLSGANLSGAHFEYANLEDADLSRAELSGADFTGATLSGAALGEASLVNICLNRAVLHDTYLYKANLTGAQCIETDFTNANLSGANLKGANCDFAKIVSTDLTRSELCNCSLVQVTLENAVFTGAFIYSCIIKDWKTRNLKCDYIYIDCKGEERLPRSRNFRPGEFEGYIKKLQAPEVKTQKKMPEGRALKHVYISFAHEDLVYIEKIANTLEINGIKVWKDKERIQPCVPWHKALSDAIENGIYFISCFSKNYCKKIETSLSEEFKIALQRLKKVHNDRDWFIPIKILRCDIPEKSIDSGQIVSGLQWIDFSMGWNEGMKRLINIISL